MKTNQTKFSIGLRGERPVLFSVIQIALWTQLQSAYVQEIRNHKESFTPTLIRFLNHYIRVGVAFVKPGATANLYFSQHTTPHAHKCKYTDSCNMNMNYSADQQTREKQNIKTVKSPEALVQH